MRMTALTTTIVALFIATAAHADPFAKADPGAGRNLLEEANCNGCHVQRMGGDASRMYTRPERKVDVCRGRIAEDRVPSVDRQLARHGERVERGA